jgi:predicted nucleic acid-binding protein
VSALYLDSSAFIKTVVQESETDALRAYLAGERGRCVSSALIRTEAMRAARFQGPETLTRVRDGLRRIDLVAVDDRILDAAGLLDPGVLRSLDAIHIATALALGDDLDAVVTYDGRMIDAASLLGIPTATPS